MMLWRLSYKNLYKRQNTVKPKLTYLQQWDSISHVYSKKVPLNNDHMSTTAKRFGPRCWSFYTGVIVFHHQEFLTNYKII